MKFVKRFLVEKYFEALMVYALILFELAALVMLPWMIYSSPQFTLCRLRDSVKWALIHHPEINLVETRKALEAAKGERETITAARIFLIIFNDHSRESYVIGDEVESALLAANRECPAIKASDLLKVASASIGLNSTR